MRLIYNHLKDFYVLPIYRKLRKEGDVTIVMSENLELGYLNSTSSFFMENVDGEHSIDEITAKMYEEYEVQQEILERDMVNLVRDLQWRKLIKLSRRKHINN